MNKLRLSVIIACSRPERVESCVHALLDQSPGGQVEIIVVGDVKPRPLIHSAEVLWISCETAHPNRRRAIGIERARGELIAFLDDDAVPQPGWVNAALRVDPDGERIVTGPERPATDGSVSGLFHAVSVHRLAQGTRVQVNFEKTSVAWYEVSFCNCVLPKTLFERFGPPASEIPWDIDDFHFCFQLRGHVRFNNDPELLIRHDRYPDSPAAFFFQKARERCRTGEKIVLYPALYLRIPPVAAAAIVPWLALFLALWPGALLSLLALYGSALLFQIPAAWRRGGFKEVVPFLGTTLLLHLVSLAGLQIGLFRGILYRLGLFSEKIVAAPFPRKLPGIFDRPGLN